MSKEDLADLLRKIQDNEALLAREDPPEYAQPACPDQIFANGTGQITVRSFLHHPYQARLVKEGLLEKLVEELRDYPELAGKTLLALVRPRYNQAYMDRPDDSSSKNHFLLEIGWGLPTSAPLDVVYEYEFLYHPIYPHERFQRMASEARYTWRPDCPGEDLEQRLLDCGVLKEIVPSNPPDSRLLQLSMVGALDLPEFVPLEKQGHVLRVAIGEPASFPTDLAAWADSRRVVEPVLVRDRQQLQTFRDHLYRGFSARKSVELQGFQPAANSNLVEISENEISRFLTPIRKEDHYHLNIFDGRKWNLDFCISRSSIVISVALFGGNLHGTPEPGVFDQLESLARDELIWRPNPGHWGWGGETWTLRRGGQVPREVSLWSPDACPLVEFGLTFMRLAGLELDVRRTVRWRKASKPMPATAMAKIQKVVGSLTRQDWKKLAALGACHRVSVQDLQRVLAEAAVELTEHPESAWPACMQVHPTSDADQWLVDVSMWSLQGKTDLALRLSVIQITEEHLGVVISDIRGV
ncbi:MAG: hypothetical protein J0I12_16845 [Candidatus Eremiobacteraeota bacterium]|nr:hypothetical protein [Candidatus Eremiobacteraeota bacterium]